MRHKQAFGDSSRTFLRSGHVSEPEPDVKKCCRLVAASRSTTLKPEVMGSWLFSHSVTSDSVAPWTEALQASWSVIVSQSLLKLTSIESVMP